MATVSKSAKAASVNRFIDGYSTMHSGEKRFKSGGWIAKAAASTKRRGTKGKCTPITKKGCSGRAKALALTFKKIARKHKNK